MGNTDWVKANTMKSSEDKICLFDMDGTLCDYDASMRSVLKDINPAGFVVPDNLHATEPYLEQQMDMIKRTPGFWKTMSPITSGYAVYLLALECGFTNMILTKGPYKCAIAWMEKVEWCQRYCPEAGVTITHASKGNAHKGLVYGRVLVDDYPPYVEQWLKFRPRGLVLMPANSSNQNFTHPQVVKYSNNLSDNEEARTLIKSRLHEAFHR